MRRCARGHGRADAGTALSPSFRPSVLPSASALHMQPPSTYAALIILPSGLHSLVQPPFIIFLSGRQDNEPLMRALSKLINLNKPDLVLFVGEALVRVVRSPWLFFACSISRASTSDYSAGTSSQASQHQHKCRLARRPPAPVCRWETTPWTSCPSLTNGWRTWPRTPPPWYAPHYDRTETASRPYCRAPIRSSHGQRRCVQQIEHSRT